MSDLLKILVDTGDSSRQIDGLTNSFVKLDKKIAEYAAKAPSALEQVDKALEQSGRSNQFVSAQSVALTALREGTAKALNLVRSQNAALQGLYEARLATSGTLSAEELSVFKKYSVSLGGMQKAQLADAIAHQKALDAVRAQKAKSATAMGLEETRLLLRMPSSADMKLLSAQLKTQMQASVAAQSAAQAAEDARYGAWLKASAATKALEDAKYAALRADSLSRGKVTIIRAAKDSLAEIKAAQSAAQAAEDARYGAWLKASAATKALEDAKYAALRADSLSRGKVTIIRAAKESLAEIRAAEALMMKAQAQGSRVGIPQTQIGGAFTAYDAQARSAAKLEGANKSLGNSFKQLTLDGNDVHSMARGLASSFGLLWLTWGNLIPLFAGAAISASVKNVVTLGAEVQHTMETIRVLSGESEIAIAGLNSQLLELARSGPMGPQEIAKAMKTLSLAGLDAGEVSSSIKDVMNFAVAGSTDMKTAADVMTTVATAFNVAAGGYNYVGDVIAKTAAVSKSSVESIGEAFKTASVLHKQYGVTLEDVGVGLAALSNLGIQGSAAGTALRNMYVDLSGRTPKVTKAMQSLGLELKDQNGRFVDLITMTERTAKALDSLSGKGRAEALHAMLSERGGKPVIELLDLAEQRAKKFTTDIPKELQRMRAAIGDSTGFMIESAVQLAMTPENQLKSITATLQATLVEAFNGMEPEILAFSRDMKDMFNSPEFKTGLQTLATSAMDFGRALVTVTATVVEHAKLFAALGVAYFAGRTALLMYAASQEKVIANRVVDTAATIANTAAERANSAAKVGAVVGLARFIPGLGAAVTVAGLAWAAYEMYVNSSKRAEQGFVDSGYGAAILKRLQEETARVKDLNEAKTLNLSLDELQARKANASGKLESTARRVAAEAELEAAIAKKAAVSAPISEAKDAKLAAKYNSDIANVAVKAATRKVEAAKEVERLQKSEISRATDLLKVETKRNAELNKPKLPDIKGTKPFALPETGASKTSVNLDSIIKREKEQEAALLATSVVTSEFDSINKELAKNLAGLSETYNDLLKNHSDLEPLQRRSLSAQKDTAEALIKSNYNRQIAQIIAKNEYDYTIKRIEASDRERQATDELTNARFKASQESERSLKLRDAQLAFDQSIKYELPVIQAGEKAKYAVRVEYAEKQRQLQIESAKKLSELMYTAEGEIRPDTGTAVAEELRTFNIAREKLKTQGLTEEAKSSSAIYVAEWDKATSQIAGNFTSKLMSGTLDLKEFMIETFASMVLQPQLQLMMQKGADTLLGGSEGLFAKLLGIPSGNNATGGLPAGFISQIKPGEANFEGGGFTGTGARSGGLDGKGGFTAMLHPQETVIDHTKSGSGNAQSSAPVYVTITNTVGDVATKSMLDQANATTVKQIQAGMARSARYNGAMSRG